MSSTLRNHWDEGRRSLMDWNESSYNLHLDLYNFESVDADGSPYILTSPRSLEACTHLGVQPIELLHKDLMKFEEECLLTGQPLSNAKMLYNLQEQQRLRNLKECRRLREGIIIEEENEHNAKNSTPRLTKSRPHSINQSKKLDQGYSRTTHPKDFEIGQGDSRNISSIKRQSSTNSTINRSKSPSSLDVTSRLPSHESTNSHVTSSGKQSRSTPSKNQRPIPCTSNAISSLARSRVRVQERPQSSCSSRNSEKSRMSTASILSNQDQKILDLLERKYKDDKLLEETRQEVRLAWDEQRQLEERSKVNNEMLRRKNLADSNWIRQKKKEQQKKQRHHEKKQEILDAEMEIKYQDIHHERLVKEQQSLLHHQLRQKKYNEMEKKKRQERALRRREEDEEEYRHSVSQHVAISLEKAQQLRDEKDHQQVKEQKQRQRQEKIRHSSMKTSLDKYNEEHMTYLKDSILVKHVQSQRNLENQQWLRQHEIKVNRKKEESLQEKSSQLRQSNDEDIRQWQNHLQYHSLMSQQRAVQQANETIQSKASKARLARRSRELTHKELIKRVEEDDAIFKETIKEDLAYKEMKSQSLAAQKEDAVMRSRVAARESAKMRDQIREKYTGTFDKMVERARHQATVGRGPQMSTKNYSSFTLT
ncbi:uncharacterized protein [Asterias amurensis]|uniref:uncharacterized protein n=1 Tax=Asterias amurensis TaxID=7602 RepID=UPI003AB60B00